MKEEEVTVLRKLKKHWKYLVVFAETDNIGQSSISTLCTDFNTDSRVHYICFTKILIAQGRQREVHLYTSY